MSSPILRFVATSDWHFGRRVPDVETLQQLIDSMAAVRPSFVLALGDFVDWHRPDDLKLIFARLAQIECPVGVLFGNHDILIPEVAVNPSTTWEALETFCGLASDAGLHPLDQEPLIVGGAYVCGTGAWYDYTLGDSEWPQEQYAEKRHEEELIRNLAIDRWGMPDAEVCTVFMSRLERDLARMPAGVIPIVVTHVTTLPGSFPRTDDARWNFMSAYWGSRRISAILRKYDARIHLHGHVHSDKHCIPESRATTARRCGPSTLATIRIGRLSFANQMTPISVGPFGPPRTRSGMISKDDKTWREKLALYYQGSSAANCISGLNPSPGLVHGESSRARFQVCIQRQVLSGTVHRCRWCVYSRSEYGRPRHSDGRRRPFRQ